MNQICSLDVVRAAYPHLGVALYAYEPGGKVTIELLSPGGDSYQFSAATEADAVMAACPELFETPAAVAEQAAPSIFD